MKQNYLKEIKGRYKAEYAADNPFTCDGLKTSIINIIFSYGFEFEKIELKDDTSLFDGGIRLSCSSVDKVNDFIMNSLNEEITEIDVFGNYNNTKVCISVMKDDNLIRASCRDNIDISSLLKNF